MNGKKKGIIYEYCFRYELLGSSLETVSHGEHSNGGGGKCGSGHSDGEVLIVSLFFFLIVFSFFFNLGFEEVFGRNSGQPSPGGLGSSFNCGFGGSDITPISGVFLEKIAGDELRKLSAGRSDLGVTAVVIWISIHGLFACSLATGGVSNTLRLISLEPGIICDAGHVVFGSAGGEKESKNVRFHL